MHRTGTVPLLVEVEPLEEGGFMASCPDMPGLYADGNSVDSALKHLRGVVSCVREMGGELRRRELEETKVRLRPYRERPLVAGRPGPTYQEAQARLRNLGLFVRCRAGKTEVWFWPRRQRWGAISSRLPLVPHRMIDELRRSLDLPDDFTPPA